MVDVELVTGGRRQRVIWGTRAHQCVQVASVSALSVPQTLTHRRRISVHVC